jgi:hypothetical protein
MLIEQLDRTQWSLKQALEHIALQVLRVTPPASATAESAPTPSVYTPHWLRPEESAAIARREAARELQVALRDGDLHAQGRLSTVRAGAWTHPGDQWDLHSGHHISIGPEQWRAGNADVDRATLTMRDGQFIDIRVPRFMVLAIWPVVESPTAAPAPDPATGMSYTTPYIELLHRAIAENGISQRYQCKKELLADWFRSQTVEGEPVSQNLADAMATLIRLPSSQRGGAKRI